MNSIDQKLKALKLDFIQGLQARFGEISMHWNEFKTDRSESELEPVHRALHSLAGSSGLYGCPDMGDLARKIEIMVHQFLSETSDQDVDSFTVRVQSDLELLKRTIDADGEVPDELVEMDESAASNDFLFEMGAMTAEKSKILITEDDADTREYLKLVLLESGHAVVEATSGEEAIIQFLREDPDIVLMDIIMPGMNGYEATSEIKSLAKTSFVPVIFLTSITDDRMLARCIEAGGDDFLNKPFSRVIINSKIAAMQRIKRLYKDLEEYQQHNEDEIRQAKHMFEAVLKRGGGLPAGIETWGVPAGNFSGDTQLVYERPGEAISIMLGDFTGHGLSPAVGTVLASEIFYRMVAAGAEPEMILAEINNSLNSVLPTGKYCAVAYIHVDLQSKKFRLFNAGLPDTYCLNSEGEVLHVVPSSNMPLGILQRSSEDFVLEDAEFDKFSNIVMYSDGVTEAENSEGEMYSEERLIRSFCQGGGSLIQRIKSSLNAFTQGCEQLDDISVISVDVNLLKF